MRAWRYEHEECFCYYVIELCDAPSYLLILSHRMCDGHVRVCNAAGARDSCGFGVSYWREKWTPCEVEEAIAYALRVP